MLSEKTIKKLILSCIIGGVVLISGCSSCKQVPAGNTGIKVRMGAVQETSLSEGLNFKIPFIEKIVLMDNRTQKTSAEGNASSSDMQSIDYKVAINFRVNPEKSANLFQKVGESYSDTIISPAIQESTKSIMAKYTAEGLIQNRVAIGEEIRAILEEKIGKYGIVIESVSIENFNFSEEFDKAIEAKQTAQQQALKAQEDLNRIKIEGEQKVVQAQAEAEANNIKANSIDDKILRQMWIEKWDGKMPTVYGGNNIMDVSSMMNQGGNQ